MFYQYLIIGLLIGIIFGMPIGAVGALSVQRTINKGFYSGLISGAASSIADSLYACIGAFGLTFISDFLLRYQLPINLAGALILIAMAIKMMSEEKVQTNIQNDAKGGLSEFISAFAIAITNPAAILSFLFAFSVFGIHGSLGIVNGTLLIVGVLIGTFLWWLLLVSLTSFMKRKLKADWFVKANKLFGTILLIFSLGVLINTL